MNETVFIRVTLIFVPLPLGIKASFNLNAHPSLFYLGTIWRHAHAQDDHFEWVSPLAFQT